MTTTEHEAPVPFPFSEAIGLKFDPTYAALREQKRVLRVQGLHGDEAWLLTRHEDVKFVLSDPRFSRALAEERDEARLTPLRIQSSLMGMDPPEHTRLRTLIASAFSGRRAEQMRGWLRAQVAELLAGIAGQESPVDLLSTFVTPLSGLTICQMLGVPYEDRIRFREYLEAFFSITALPVAEVAAGINAMYDYIGELIERKQQEPGDDVITELIRARDETGKCSEEELVHLANVLLLAGYHTTASQLASSLYVLMTQTDQTRLLLENPNLLPQAVDELLRYVPLIAHVTFARYTTEDVEVGGTLIPAGQAVLLAIPSANRDGEVFESADELNLCRAKNPHLAFGYGVHHCVGANLVRVQLQEALRGVFGRFPDIVLAVPASEVEWIRGTQARCPSSLPVIVGADHSAPR